MTAQMYTIKYIICMYEHKFCIVDSVCECVRVCVCACVRV